MDKKSIPKMLIEVFGETTTPFSGESSSKYKDKEIINDDIVMEDFNEAQDSNEGYSEEMIEGITVYLKGDWNNSPDKGADKIKQSTVVKTTPHASNNKISSQKDDPMT